MELLDLAALAAKSDMPLRVAMEYRDRFIMFVPCVRIGRKLMHPIEAVDVLRSIEEWEQAGRSPDEIEDELIERMPVTVISAQAIESNASVAPVALRTGLRSGGGAIEALATERDSEFDRRLKERFADLSAECRMRDHTAQEVAQARHDETCRMLADLQRQVERSTFAAERGADLVAQRLITLARGDVEREDLVGKVDVLAQRIDGMTTAEDEPTAWLQREMEEDRGRLAMLGLEVGLMAGAVSRLTTAVEASEPDPALGILRDEIAERNAAFTRTITSLTTILRGEFARLTGGIDELHAKLADLPGVAHAGESSGEPPIAFADDAPAAEHGTAAAVLVEGAAESAMSGLARPPRRMGQPFRPIERWSGAATVIAAGVSMSPSAGVR